MLSPLLLCQRTSPSLSAAGCCLKALVHEQQQLYEADSHAFQKLKHLRLKQENKQTSVPTAKKQSIHTLLKRKNNKDFRLQGTQIQLQTKQNIRPFMSAREESQHLIKGKPLEKIIDVIEYHDEKRSLHQNMTQAIDPCTFNTHSTSLSAPMTGFLFSPQLLTSHRVSETLRAVPVSITYTNQRMQPFHYENYASFQPHQPVLPLRCPLKTPTLIHNSCPNKNINRSSLYLNSKPTQERRIRFYTQQNEHPKTSHHRHTITQTTSDTKYILDKNSTIFISNIQKDTAVSPNSQNNLKTNISEKPLKDQRIKKQKLKTSKLSFRIGPHSAISDDGTGRQIQQIRNINYVAPPKVRSGNIKIGNSCIDIYENSKKISQNQMSQSPRFRHRRHFTEFREDVSTSLTLRKLTSLHNHHDHSQVPITTIQQSYLPGSSLNTITIHNNGTEAPKHSQIREAESVKGSSRGSESLKSQNSEPLLAVPNEPSLLQKKYLQRLMQKSASQVKRFQ